MNILNRISGFVNKTIMAPTNAIVLKNTSGEARKIVDLTIKGILESDIKLWDGIDDLTVPRLVCYNNDYVFAQFKDDKYFVVDTTCHITYVNKERLFAPAFIALAEQLLPIYKNNLFVAFKKLQIKAS